MSSLRLFIRLSRPLYLLGVVFLYFLGAGVAHYLGTSIHWGVYLLGQVWVILVQLGAQYLSEYFEVPIDRQFPSRTPFSGGSGALDEGKLPRPIALWAGITSIGLATAITVVVMLYAKPGAATYVVLGLIFAGAFFYSIPPFRLVSSGFGELTNAIIVANLVPVLSFLLQTSDLHRLLAMSTFPLTFLYLAMILNLEFPDYAGDLKFEKRNLLMRLGWQRGMMIHNILLLGGFILLGLAAVLGLPLHIMLSAMLVLPLGIFQIWMVNRIAKGAKPNWSLTTITALSSFGLTVYMLAYAFWTR